MHFYFKRKQNQFLLVIEILSPYTCLIFWRIAMSFVSIVAILLFSITLVIIV